MLVAPHMAQAQCKALPIEVTARQRIFPESLSTWSVLQPQPLVVVVVRPEVATSVLVRPIYAPRSYCYEVGKRFWGKPKGIQVFVGVMAESLRDLSYPTYPVRK